VFFKMLVNIGVIYFALGNLGILETITGMPPTLAESLIASFTLNDLLGSFELPFTGINWDIVRIVSSFLVFYWLVIVISMISSDADMETELYEAQLQKSLNTVNRSAVTSAYPMAQVSNETQKVRIVEALVNPKGSDGNRETLTIQSNSPVDLDGWRIMNGRGQLFILPSVRLESNVPMKFVLPPSVMRLSNDGDTLKLLNSNGLEVHQVSYRAKQAESQGIPIRFET
jgi:hypothetical protein